MPRPRDNITGFGRNIRLYYAAIGVIVLGYVFLAIGSANSMTSLTIGPVLLVIGYLVAIPVALLRGTGTSDASSDGERGPDTKT